jgi:hypothetical protein
MNTALLFEYLQVAILASAITVPVVQRVKGWLPNDLWVDPVSVVIGFAIGLCVAVYFASYTWIAGVWVGLFTVAGAEGIYKLLGDKLQSYAQKIGYIEPMAEADPVIPETEEQGDPQDPII